MRGSWVDFEFDSNDLLYVRIDKKKKLLVTTFLQALGIARDAIIPLFYKFDTIQYDKGTFYQKLNDSLIGVRFERGMTDLPSEDDFAGRRLTKDLLKKLEKLGVDRLMLTKNALVNRAFGADVIDPKTGEILVEQGDLFTDETIETFKIINL